MYAKTRKKMVDMAASLPFGLGDFLMQSEFSRNVIKLSTGSAIVTALGFCLQPINTRLFTPEMFGIANLLISVSALFSVVIGFNISPVIVMEKNDRIAIATASLNLILVVVSIALIGCLFVLFSDDILILLKAQQIKPWLPLVFLGLIFGAISQPFVAMMTRRKQFGEQSKINVISTISAHAVRLPWGLLAPSFFAIYVSGFIATVVSFVLSIKAGRFRFTKSKRQLVFVFKRNLSFMSFQTLNAILNVMSVQIPIFWIMKYCGAVEVGFYGMAVTLVDVPCNLFLNSIRQVYYKRVADTVAHEPEKLMSLYWRTTWKTTLVGLFPLCAVFFGSFFISFFFGERWASLAPILQLFVAWRFINIILLPIGSIIIVLRKNFIVTIMGVFWLLTIVAACYLAAPTPQSLISYILVITLPSIVVWFLIVVYFIKQLNKK